MAVSPDTRRITAYIHKDLKAQADRLAALDNRNLSNFIECLLRAAVEDAEGEGIDLSA